MVSLLTFGGSRRMFKASASMVRSYYQMFIELGTADTSKYLQVCMYHWTQILYEFWLDRDELVDCITLSLAHFREWNNYALALETQPYKKPSAFLIRILLKMILTYVHKVALKGTKWSRWIQSSSRIWKEQSKNLILKGNISVWFYVIWH